MCPNPQVQSAGEIEGEFDQLSCAVPCLFRGLKSARHFRVLSTLDYEPCLSDRVSLNSDFDRLAHRYLPCSMPHPPAPSALAQAQSSHSSHAPHAYLARDQSLRPGPPPPPGAKTRPSRAGERCFQNFAQIQTPIPLIQTPIPSRGGEIGVDFWE